jgi:hypothetical protein
MGKSKSTTETNATTTSTATPTAQETQLNDLQMQMIQGGMGTGGAFGSVINKLLLGQDLGGAYNSIYGIDPSMASNIAAESVRGIPAYMQQGGILDSGTAASVYGRTYGDTLRNVAQFNAGQQMNALGAGIGGYGQQNQLLLGGMSDLGNRLAGLRSVTGTQQGMTTQKNPFITGSDIMGGVGMAFGGAMGLGWNPFSSLGAKPPTRINPIGAGQGQGGISFTR